MRVLPGKGVGCGVVESSCGPGAAWGHATPGVSPGGPIRSGGVSIRCTITMFARLWRCQGGIKREPAAPGGPGGAQGVPQGVSGCSFSVSGFSFGVSERSSSCFSDLRTVPSRLQTLLRSKFHENLLQSYFKVLFRGRRQWPQASRMCTFGVQRLLAVDPKGSRPFFRRGLKPLRHASNLCGPFLLCMSALQPVVSLGPHEGATTHHYGLPFY